LYVVFIFKGAAKMTVALDWKGDDETGYIAEADDVVYIVEPRPSSDPHSYAVEVHRTKKDEVPILWSEALADPRRGLIGRVISEGDYISYRTIMDTIHQGMNFAERDYKRRTDGEPWRRGP
jgi:hypothetical protein